jgi:hypothetical protein
MTPPRPRGSSAIKRDLVLAVDESLFPEIKGQADTEVLFCLALTFGLADDPPDAAARAIGFIEACGRRRGVTDPFQGTIAASDGESLWVFRYSSEGKSRSLFFSRDARTVKRQYPERPALQQLSDDARFVVSEPIGDLPGAWAELPEASYGVVSEGGDQSVPGQRPSRADPPAAPGSVGDPGRPARVTGAVGGRLLAMGTGGLP